MESLWSALSRPDRRRIVELLAQAPRSVGEVSQSLGLRQPQATKHLQALERAGLVTVHPLGQRRIYALRRDPLRELGSWLDALGEDSESEAALANYQAAIAAEAVNPTRLLRIQRRLPAPPAAVWEAWTSEALVRRWWAPHHFEVAGCTVDATPGGALRIVMREGDGTRHTATGRFVIVEEPERLVFDLGPHGPDGAPLFSARHDVRLSPRDGATQLNLTIRVQGGGPAAAPALAGMRPGWYQLLDKLAALLGQHG